MFHEFERISFSRFEKKMGDGRKVLSRRGGEVKRLFVEGF